jgi:hypothetical protein
MLIIFFAITSTIKAELRFANSHWNDYTETMNAAPLKPGQMAPMEPPPKIEPSAAIPLGIRTEVHNTYYKAEEVDGGGVSTGLITLVILGVILLGLVVAYPHLTEFLEI